MVTIVAVIDEEKIREKIQRLREANENYARGMAEFLGLPVEMVKRSVVYKNYKAHNDALIEGLESLLRTARTRTRGRIEESRVGIKVRLRSLIEKGKEALPPFRWL